MQTQSNDFLNSNKAVFILLGWASILHPRQPITLHSQLSNHTTAGSVFPPESHWSAAMSAGDNQLKCSLDSPAPFQKPQIQFMDTFITMSVSD